MVGKTQMKSCSVQRSGRNSGTPIGRDSVTLVWAAPGDRALARYFFTPRCVVNQRTAAPEEISNGSPEYISK
jgi:hypothetical protein